MDKIEVVNKIKEIGVVAVIRGNNPEEAVAMSEACIKGGVTAIELAFTTPRAHEAIRELAKKYADNPDVVIGAGGALTGGGKTADEITETAKKFVAAVKAVRPMK